MPDSHKDKAPQTGSERSRIFDRLPSLSAIGRGALFLLEITYATGGYAVEMAKKAAAEYPASEYPENKDENI